MRLHRLGEMGPGKPAARGDARAALARPGAELVRNERGYVVVVSQEWWHTFEG